MAETPKPSEFSPEGIKFLQEHGLLIIRVGEERFKVPEGKPFIVATDEDDFHLQYSDGSSTTTACIVDHSRVTSHRSAVALLNFLADYEKKVDRYQELGPKVFQLKTNEALPVYLNSPGWEKSLKLIEQYFPGTLIWPQEPSTLQGPTL